MMCSSPRSATRRLASLLFLAGLVLATGNLAATEIWEIQGDGPASPLVGQVVTTGPNVVTALTSRGFFMQTPAARSDGDPATSDGLYVYLGRTPGVEVGDLVDVTGTVSEYHGMTELSGTPQVTVEGHGAGLPAPVDFGPELPSPDDPPAERSLEPYEDMLVRIGNGTVSGPLEGTSNFWVVARQARAFREPGILYPGQPGLPVWDGNPEVLEAVRGGIGEPAASPDTGLGAGLGIHGLVGPLAYAWGHYQIWTSKNGYTVEGQLEAHPVPPRSAGEITVATQNVEHLEDTVDDPDTKDEVLSPEALETKLAKLSLWIRTVLDSPTVLALEEVENIGVLGDLADRILADGGPRYAPYLVEGNDIGGIDTGFLVAEDVDVDSLEQLEAGARFEYGGSDFTLWDRPPLLLQGRYTGNGAPFPLTLLAVHLRSMNGIDGDNAGFVREKRHQQALHLSRLIQQLQEDDPGIRLIVLGDFNAFEFTDGWVDVLGQVTGRPDPRGAEIPATKVVDPPLNDQVLAVPRSSRYSFVHEGNAQVLDHILTSTGLTPWIRGAVFAHGNADAPDSDASLPDTALRCSDHDGLVLYLMTDGDGDGIPDDREAPTPRWIPARIEPQPGLFMRRRSEGPEAPRSVVACGVRTSVRRK